MNKPSGEKKEIQGVLLIHPPLTKVCEPPGGPARLLGALRNRNVASRIWDANVEGQLALLKGVGHGGAKDLDTWTYRALRRREEHLAAFRSWDLYRHPERYRRAAADLNRLLAVAARPYGVRLSLTDYESVSLSPFRSGDLFRAAAAPEANPFYPWFQRRLPEVLAETPVTHVGFSVNYLSQALTAFAMIGFLRKRWPWLRIVLGGGLITSWSCTLGAGNPFPGLADDLISGPGEGPLLTLLGEKAGSEPVPPFLDGFPLEDYLAPGAVLPYSTAGGCWWGRCSFCPERAEGHPYRPLSEEQVISDLHRLSGQFKPALIHLLDNALSPSLLAALATRPPGAPWYGFVRVTPHLANLEMCLRLRKAGCVMLKLGLESGDQEVLDSLQKGLDLKTASVVLENLKRAGIATYVYLLFGTPAETPEAARRTLAFTIAHADKIGFLNLALFNFPVADREGEAFAGGKAYPGDLSLYRPFVHPRGWNRGEVRHFLEREFRKEPAVATILRRDPLFFTSNHAPFFAMAPVP